MHFIALSFYNFRNLETTQKIDCDAKKVFLIGNNGTGKTNFLDIVYTLCYGSSFKALDRDNAQYGTNNWKLSGIKSNDKLFDTITVSWNSNTGKQYYLNEKQIHDRKYLISINPAILFSYEDLAFVKGSHEARRVFIDQTASLCSDDYIETLRNYKKILKLRNFSLKTQNLALLDIYTEQLAHFAFDLVQKRKFVIAELSEIFSDTVFKITNGLCKLSLHYKASLDETSVNDFVEHIEKLRDRELLAGMTLKGPHRDRIEFLDAIGDFSERASMGQLRSIALSLRIAQSLIFSKFRGTNPVHLYDDVLLELDYEKRIQFIQHLPPSSQSFFTFLPTEPYNDYIDDKTILIEVTNGKFIHRNSI